MSFFGAFFAGFTLIAKGISKGQDIVEDNKLKNRAKELGRDSYYDSKGILHDSKTGRAITYHTDPFTGHRLIQDAYTLNTIRDITTEEKWERLKKNKEIAKEKGEEFYEVGKPFDVLGRIEWMKIERKYRWKHNGRMWIWKNGDMRRSNNEKIYSLNNLRYDGISTYHTALYRKENEIGYYIKEKYDEFYVFTSLNTGKVINVENESKKKLEEVGIDWEEFIKAINDLKEKEAKFEYDEITMSACI